MELSEEQINEIAQRVIQGLKESNALQQTKPVCQGYFKIVETSGRMHEIRNVFGDVIKPSRPIYKIMADGKYISLRCSLLPNQERITFEENENYTQ